MTTKNEDRYLAYFDTYVKHFLKFTAGKKNSDIKKNILA